MKKARFDAFVRVTVETSVSLQAGTFEEAIAEAKALKERDVVKFSGDFNEGAIEVTGIYKYMESLR